MTQQVTDKKLDNLIKRWTVDIKTQQQNLESTKSSDINYGYYSGYIRAVKNAISDLKKMRRYI